ncbi:cysteine hydrolase [Ponticoccus sp. SC2-23]|uniref:isochorismatase family cysteine hydrolase n=1 Tax=Alexandriicola marinus TaxID=2081710 RepID=UPI000FDC910F|nr:isochorismatase family cysteine hydrolase [Alexandriicola marinus]MBM1221276.1 cysteine hydrolase [Ponticoccus sp. SC6-9]MBM1225846.1 cysteine hydrolase [Ponticoccus sp. SC6-15]MBM1227998.1 cysteine hydrolase [Ponticoccus sp. SC6-38]MBM1234364.1 cysteine hydrolase [Ponticoccus sp. SC6-45]MBM1238500.1 cysteine hydrolase [Ponticoccus sp. SC6-49]MBM1243769.1 cysteine hydrolase [Ponticoccus sp. SC2-64]MBM1247888.1 cysteine hydrolase [Ponticoccus sp. SC6-42]MBM1252900.1 cysteine hydrolase [Po
MAHDPYYDLVPPPQEPDFDPSRTALLTIDLQYLDAHPDGWMGRLCREQGKPNHLDERWAFIDEILPRVRRLQDACRAGGVELIHIRVKYLTADCRDGQRSLQQETKARSADARDDEFLPEVAPQGDEIIIDKTSAGTFNSTPIDQILRNMGIDRLLVCGIVTEGCVELTARDAADRGYYVNLVQDACASSTRVAHDDALQRMSDGGLIRLRDTAEIERLLQGQSAPAELAAVPG